MENLSSISLPRVLSIHRYKKIGIKVNYFRHDHEFFTSSRHLRFSKP